MKIFAGNQADEVWARAVATLSLEGDIVPSRNGDTKELLAVTMDIKNPAKRLVTSYGRPVAPAFALAEVLWILAGRQDVAMLQHYNSQIGNYSDDGRVFNAAYGYRLRSEFGHDQIDDVIQLLRADAGSRQAVLNIWSPIHDYSYEPDGTPNRTADRACNLVAHLLIRNDRLHWLQTMRSNDAFWGTPNNFMQWMHLQQFVANRLGVEMGSYTHVAHSFHLYQQHWDQAMDVRSFDLYGELAQDQHGQMFTGHGVLQEVMQYEKVYRAGGTTMVPDPAAVGPYWHQVLAVLRAWSLYKANEDRAAFTTLMSMQDQVLAAAQIRYFYWWRWHKKDYASLIKDLVGRFPESVEQWIGAGNQADVTF
jgi:thymidylate synthase